jgi:hypothetical protein
MNFFLQNVEGFFCEQNKNNEKKNNFDYSFSSHSSTSRQYKHQKLPPMTQTTHSQFILANLTSLLQPIPTELMHPNILEISPNFNQHFFSQNSSENIFTHFLSNSNLLHNFWFKLVDIFNLEDQNRFKFGPNCQNDHNNDQYHYYLPDNTHFPPPPHPTDVETASEPTQINSSSISTGILTQFEHSLHYYSVSSLILLESIVLSLQQYTTSTQLLDQITNVINAEIGRLERIDKDDRIRYEVEQNKILLAVQKNHNLVSNQTNLSANFPPFRSSPNICSLKNSLKKLPNFQSKSQKVADRQSGYIKSHRLVDLQYDFSLLCERIKWFASIVNAVKLFPKNQIINPNFFVKNSKNDPKSDTNPKSSSKLSVTNKSQTMNDDDSDGNDDFDSHMNGNDNLTLFEDSNSFIRKQDLITMYNLFTTNTDRLNENKHNTNDGNNNVVYTPHQLKTIFQTEIFRNLSQIESKDTHKYHDSDNSDDSDDEKGDLTVKSSVSNRGTDIMGNKPTFIEFPMDSQRVDSTNSYHTLTPSQSVLLNQILVIIMPELRHVLYYGEDFNEIDKNLTPKKSPIKSQSSLITKTHANLYPHRNQQCISKINVLYKLFLTVLIPFLSFSAKYVSKMIISPPISIQSSLPLQRSIFQNRSTFISYQFLKYIQNQGDFKKNNLLNLGKNETFAVFLQISFKKFEFLYDTLSLYHSLSSFSTCPGVPYNNTHPMLYYNRKYGSKYNFLSHCDNHNDNPQDHKHPSSFLTKNPINSIPVNNSAPRFNLVANLFANRIKKLVKNAPTVNLSRLKQITQPSGHSGSNSTPMVSIDTKIEEISKVNDHMVSYYKVYDTKSLGVMSSSYILDTISLGRFTSLAWGKPKPGD